MLEPFVELTHHADSSLPVNEDNKQEEFKKNGQGATHTKQAKAGLASKLFGILPRDADLIASKEERLSGI